MIRIDFGKLPGRAASHWQSKLLRTAFLLLACGVMLLDTASLNAPLQAFMPKASLEPAAGAGQADENLRPWRERDYAAINRQFDGLDTSFPRDLIKAIAWCESEWRQVDESGRLFITVNRQRAAGKSRSRRITLDYGVMQINERMASLDRKSWDWDLIKNNPEYNLKAGVAVLEGKVAYLRALKRRPNWKHLEARYRLKGHDDLDLVLKAYNGFQPSWAYPRRIRAALRDKPWEKAVLRQLFQEANRPEAVFIALAPEQNREVSGLNPGLGPALTARSEPAPEADDFFFSLDISHQ